MKSATIFPAIAALLFAQLAPAVDEPVQLASGQISGVELDSGVKAFLGIPFAAPPVGDLRWKPPQPPIPWQGVRPATQHGPACMQRLAPHMSEDCLYLNVWTGAQSADERRPVMVWIHGGGWRSGSASVPIYDGEGFAGNGVVLVSVNYRMGAFGWMAHPALSAESPHGVSGNYGILDHLAALEWVRDNAAAFGGDPGNVTIFGESAGGASVYALLATPMAAGLFHKAIAQSTWITASNVTNLKTPNGMTDSAEQRGAAAMEAALQQAGLGDGEAPHNIRALSAAQLLETDLGVSLIVDGHLFPESPGEIFAAGSHNVVPLLAGVNDGEGLFFVRPDRTFDTVAAQRAAREEEFGASGASLLDYYVAAAADDIFRVEVDYNTDSWFARPTRELLLATARSGAPAYMYLFTRNLGDPARRSPHAMELRYVFNTLPEDAPAEDQRIARLMMDYWTAFAASGAPAADDLPRWPRYDPQTRQHQVLGVEVGQGAMFRQQQLDELDRWFNARYASAR